MKVLSLFDGISCARVALDRAGIKVDEYNASELDKYAIQISEKNYPDITHIGDVKNVSKIPNMDLLIGGSPCQDLSISKANRQGLGGARSSLFFEYVRILKASMPKYFILENVNSMSKVDRDIITGELFGIEPVMINAALVSAQNRKRLFWIGAKQGDTYTRVDIEQPEDRNIFLQDILENGDVDRLKSYCIDANYHKGSNWDQYIKKGRRQLVRIGHFNSGGQGDRIYSSQGKSVTLSANGGGRGAKTGLYAVALTEVRTEEAKMLRKKYKQETGKDFSPRRMKELVPRHDGKTNTITTGTTKNSLVLEDTIIRKLTPIECERLQGLCDGYTDGVSNTQRYKCLGNAFNVDVVAHILKHLVENNKE